MIDLKITPEGWNRDDAHVKIWELNAGQKIIHIGRDLDVVRNWFPDRSILPSGMFNNQEDYFERGCENIISHESLHIVLHSIEGYDAAGMLDNIDRPPHSFMIVGDKV